MLSPLATYAVTTATICPQWVCVFHKWIILWGQWISCTISVRRQKPRYRFVIHTCRPHGYSYNGTRLASRLPNTGKFCQYKRLHVKVRDMIKLYFVMMETLFNFYVSFFIRLRYLFSTKNAILDAQKDVDQFSDLLESFTLHLRKTSLHWSWNNISGTLFH